MEIALKIASHRKIIYIKNITTIKKDDNKIIKNKIKNKTKHNNKL